MKTAVVAFIAGIPLALLCGVASLDTVSFGQDAGNARLPIGSTLLGAADTGCNGDLVIESGISRANDRERRISAGQNVLFEVDSSNVGWSCVGESERSDTMECPSETTHVRIAFSDSDDVVLFECFGSSGGR